MGGGASKCNYIMVTDRQLTKAHYQRVEGNAPRNNTVSVHTSPDSSIELNCSSDMIPPIRKGKSMIVMSAPSSASKLKKGSSEKAFSLAEQRKAEHPSALLKKGKSEAHLSFQAPGKGRMTMSARLPWLVKDASISSATAGGRITYGGIIGKGLMGTVRVCELDSGKFVAVKSISKKYVKKHNDLRHVTAERDILRAMTSPFCIRLFGTYQDSDYVHLVMEYAPGGELFRRITRRESFSSEVAKFYTAEVFLALVHVHSLGYVFRDLKPENVMLDEYGHCKLVDFGFAREPNGDGLCTTNVGTPAYLSPEQLNGKFTQGYTKIVDWWALGVFLYELLASKTPFCNNFNESAFEIYSRVLAGKIKFPSSKFGAASKDLVSSLLHGDVKRRLVDPRGIEKHGFFADVDWTAVQNRQVIPPFTPRLPTAVSTAAETVCHFEDWGPDNNPPPAHSSTGDSARYSVCADPDFLNF